ncbi:MAG: hypothetical protein RBS80_27105 [Thermoguttaceae bacterium]|nr:hypothetical protein [Thermoguttaceae bacterium]
MPTPCTGTTWSEATEGRMIVRGASWRDRPHRAAASYRLDYRRYHKIFNVGFRIIAEQE